MGAAGSPAEFLPGFLHATLTRSGPTDRRARPYSRQIAVFIEANIMKIRNSLKSLKDRHRDNRVIRRRGRTYVINKTNRRFKARQG